MSNSSNHRVNGKHVKPRIVRDDATQRLRLALYSHDAMGVGHVRRNLLIAQRCSEAPSEATSLIICGVHEASAFTGGHGVDCLTLPSFEKHDNDDYRPRDLRMSSDAVSNIRTKTLRSALVAMSPDIMLVDKVPRGLHNELATVLPELRQRCGTRIIFGMRDVLDAPERVCEEWRRYDYEAFIRDNYDEVWVYGDPSVYDPIQEYKFASLSDMVRYTGYFDQRERLRFTTPLDPATRSVLGDLSRTVLCMVGGGQDGGELADAFVKVTFPDGLQGLLITGPLMDSTQRERLMAAAAARPDLRVVRHVPDADLVMREVRQVVSMGGYNSMLSVVSFGIPGLIVPRVHPRLEQFIRAQRFQELGLLDLLKPGDLSPAAISEWIARDKSFHPSNYSRLDLNGLGRVAELVSAAAQEIPIFLRGIRPLINQETA